MRNYLAAAAPKELRNAGQIYIPPGPRLGDVVINVENLRKSFEYVHTVHIMLSCSG